MRLLARPLGVLALLLASSLLLPAADAGPRPKPNLKVVAVENPPAKKVEGGAFVVANSVRNTARGRAGASEVRFYLTRDPKLGAAERKRSENNPRTSIYDLPLAGDRKVKPLAGREHSATEKRKSTALRVPIGTPPGRWHLVACADDTGKVTESKEHENCRTAKRTIQVTADPKQYTLQAFSDQEVLLDDETARANLERKATTLCVPVPAAPEPSLKNALASIDARLKAADPEALAAYKRSPESKDARKSARAAVAALTNGTPGAALAALVGAHRKDPDNAAHLVNAAAVASSTGMPAEALALLNGAERLDLPGTTPMGINRQVAALTTRGNALLKLGRFGDAERVLSAATDFDASFTEAVRNLALAKLCLDKDDDAFRLARRAARRQENPQPLDESRGRPIQLRSLQLPPTPDEAAADRAFYREIHGQQFTEITQANEENQALDARRKNSPLTKANERRLRILRVYANTGLETPAGKAVKAEHSEYGSTAGKIMELRANYWGYTADTQRGTYPEMRRAYPGIAERRQHCVPATRDIHQAWLNAMTRYIELSGQLVAIYSRRATATASYIKDPIGREEILLDARQFESTVFYGIAQHVKFWAEDMYDHRQECVESSAAGQQENVTPEAAEASAELCNGAAKGLNFNFVLGPISFAVNCESVTGGIATEGWIAGFAELGYDFKSGTVTAFAGAVGKLDAEGLPVAGDFKSGIYVSADGNGPKDIGWRVGPSYTVGTGAVTYSGSDTVDMTFVGAIDNLIGF